LRKAYLQRAREASRAHEVADTGTVYVGTEVRQNGLRKQNAVPEAVIAQVGKRSQSEDEVESAGNAQCQSMGFLRLISGSLDPELVSAGRE
jgi:hypothetical protein